METLQNQLPDLQPYINTPNVVLALAILALVASFITLIRRRAALAKALATLDTQFRARHDFIAQHQELPPYMKARTGALRLQEKLSQEIEAERTLARLTGVNDIARAGLQKELAAARRTYNNAVSHFNHALKSFPHLLIARLLDMKDYPYYEADDGFAQQKRGEALYQNKEPRA